MTVSGPIWSVVARTRKTTRSVPAMSSVLFRHVKVFDGSGLAPFAGSVLTNGETIQAVAHDGEVLPAPGAFVVEGRGGFLLPGLVEAHAHLTFPSSVGRIFSKGLDLPPEDHLLVAAHNARVLLDHGFTSAYSAGPRGQRFEVALRDEIDAGYLPGLRLRASPQETGGSMALGLPPSHDTRRHPRTVAGLKDYVSSMAQCGVDSIKFELSGNDVDAPGGSSRVLFSEAEVAAISAQAAESGGLALLPCAGRGQQQAGSAARVSRAVPLHVGG